MGVLENSGLERQNVFSLFEFLEALENDQPHIHFKNGTAINFDGSMHHGSIKDLKITNQIAKWLLNNGWSIPSLK